MELNESSIVTLVIGIPATIKVIMEIWRGTFTRVKVTPEEYKLLIEETILPKESIVFKEQMEKQVIDSLFGVIATKREFNNLVKLISKTKFNLNQIKLINSFLRFENERPKIGVSAADWFLFSISIISSVALLIFSFLIDYFLPKNSINVLISLTTLFATGFPLRYIILPLILAKKISKKIECVSNDIIQKKN